MKPHPFPVLKRRADMPKPNFDEWLDKHYDQVLDWWTEYLNDMRDSRVHVMRLAKSDAAFMEFAREVFEEGSL